MTKAADRSPPELLGLARLAAAVGSSRRDSFTDMAAAAAPNDPNILMEAYVLAIQSGRDDEPHVAKWLSDAVRLSGDDGPLKSMSVSEMIEGLPERRKRLETLSDQLRRGDLPFFVASEVTHRSLMEAHLATLVKNGNLTDPSRKTLLPVFSGGRLAQPLAASKVITLDIGAIFNLSYLNLLGVVVEAFDEVKLPHSVRLGSSVRSRSFLFPPAERTAAAHRLRRWMRKEQVSILMMSTRHPKGSMR